MSYKDLATRQATGITSLAMGLGSPQSNKPKALEYAALEGL